MRKKGICTRASWLLASLVCLLILSACSPSSVDVTWKTLQETYEIYYRYEDGNHCRVMHPGREMETVFPWPCVPAGAFSPATLKNFLSFRKSVEIVKWFVYNEAKEDERL